LFFTLKISPVKLKRLSLAMLWAVFFAFSSSIASAQQHTNNITVRSDRVFILNGKPFFPIGVNCELGPDNYHCQLRKPDGSSWGFNFIDLQTEVTWHFKRFGGYCAGNPDLDYCGSGYRIRNTISGDPTTGPQYNELLAPMGWDISWYANGNRIFNYLDNDMYIFSDDYAFYPNNVDWFEENGGCENPICFSDCDSINPRFDQAVRDSAIDRIDSLARLPNSRLIGFYGLDDPTLMHTKPANQNEQYFLANIQQQLTDLQNTAAYSKQKYPNSLVLYSEDVLYGPKIFDPAAWQDSNVVLNNWVNDMKRIAAGGDAILSVFYDASQWASNWRLYPRQDLAMWFPNHIEQTLIPRVVNTANHPVALLGGVVFDEVSFAPLPPYLDAKTKWLSYVGLEKGATGLYYFGWHKGKDNDTIGIIWNSIRNLVDTLVNVKQLTTNVFTKTNLGATGHFVTGSSSPNVSYAVYQNDGWNDYYLLVTNNPNGVINEAPEPVNVVTLSSSVDDWKLSTITEVFSNNTIQVSKDGTFQYPFECWGVALFHIHSYYQGTSSTPGSFYLKQNYPNPFNPSTQINYGIPYNTHVTITVYDMAGKRVAVLVNTDMNAGNYSTTFFGTNFPSGIYFCKIIAGDFEDSKKLVLIK